MKLSNLEFSNKSVDFTKYFQQHAKIGYLKQVKAVGPQNDDIYCNAVNCVFVSVT